VADGGVPLDDSAQPSNAVTPAQGSATRMRDICKVGDNKDCASKPRLSSNST